MSRSLLDLMNDVSQNQDSSGYPLRLSNPDLFRKYLNSVLENDRFDTGNWGIRQITSRTGLPQTPSGSNSVCQWRSWQYSYVPVEYIQIVIPNFYVGSAASNTEHTNGGIMTVTNGVEFSPGAWAPITWNGVLAGTIADGVYGVSDLIKVPKTITPYTKFRISGLNSVAGGGKVSYMNYTNSCDRYNGDEFLAGAQSDHTLDSTYIGAGQGQVGSFQPALVLGYSHKPVALIVDDSIGNGTNQENFSPNGARGIWAPAIAEFMPVINFSAGGDRADQFLLANTQRQAMAQLGNPNYGFLGLGTNDLVGGSRTSAQLTTDRASIRALAGFSGIKGWTQRSILPRTTGSWDTIAGQTVTAAEAQRLAFNQLQRAPTSRVLYGSWDCTALMEYGTGVSVRPIQDGGFWVPGGTDDGTHPKYWTYTMLNNDFRRYMGARAF